MDAVTQTRAEGWKTKRVTVGNGDHAIGDTIRLMTQLAVGPEGAQHPAVRMTATQIVQGVGNRDFYGEIGRIFAWAKKNIAFRGEFGETLQSPLVTLKLRAGDCDDFSTLVSALLRSLGHRTRFKTVAIRGRDFSHVYVQVLDRRTGAWIALDPTVAQATVGWEPPQVSRAKAWTGMGEPTPTTLSRGTETALQVIDRLSPLIQAGAVRLAYGKNAGLAPFQQDFSKGQINVNSPNFTASANIGSGLTWPWMLGGALVIGGLFYGLTK